jgi:hypothetical protein
VQAALIEKFEWDGIELFNLEEWNITKKDVTVKNTTHHRN